MSQRHLLLPLAGLLVAVSIALSLYGGEPIQSGGKVKVYQVTALNTEDYVLDLSAEKSATTQISICNTGSQNGYVHFGLGAVDTGADLMLPPNGCPPSLFIRQSRLAFRGSVGGSTTFQVIVVFKD